MPEFRLIIIILSMSVLCGLGCSTINSACEAVLPTIVTTQAELADVQRAIADVEASGIRDALPEAQQAVFDEAMSSIRHGYAIAVQSLAIASDACSQPDLSGAIALIVDAWEVIRTFIALVGGPETQTHQIADPLMYVEARR